MSTPIVSSSGQKSPPTSPLAAASPGFLLSLVRRGLVRTRKDLIELTGLSRSTVTQRLGLLAGVGLLAEVEGGESSGGRPPGLLQFQRTAGWLLAANLTQTHCSTALTDLDGEPLALRTSPIALASGPRAVLDQVRDEFRHLLRGAPGDARPVAGVGIGIPGPIEFSTGRVVRPPAMPGWDDTVVPPYLADFGAPVVVDNDVHLMALGEWERHHPGADTLVYVKVDSGIGSGIVSRGELFRGAQGAAGGIGHIQLDEHSDVPCTCGNRGCLAAVASGGALAGRLRASGVPAETTEDVVNLVRSGHPDAVQLVRQAGREIGRVLAGMVNILNPSIVVIGGALARTDEVLLAGVREIVYRRSPPLATRELRITTSALGEDAGAVGAALLSARLVLSPGYVDAKLGYGPVPSDGAMGSAFLIPSSTAQARIPLLSRRSRVLASSSKPHRPPASPARA